MKIVRNLNDDGNISSDLFSFLTQIEDDTNLYYNDEHKLRHPLSICSLGQSRFFAAYSGLMDYINPQTDISRITGNNMQLFNKTNEVIESFICYIDDIYSIFKCFYPENSTTKNNRFCDQWLANIDKPLIQEFKKNIEFTYPFRTINNEIKHNHGRLFFISLKAGIIGNAFGFFITKYENGSLNSFEEVHKKIGNMQTAFSYNWFLLEILAQFYFINKYAADTLRKIIINLHNLDIKQQKAVIENSDIKTIINKLNNTLSRVLFEDEYEKQISQVEYSSNELIVRRSADSGFRKRFKIPHKLQYEAIMSGDGTTRTFSVPYLGKR